MYDIIPRHKEVAETIALDTTVMVQEEKLRSANDLSLSQERIIRHQENRIKHLIAAIIILGCMLFLSMVYAIFMEWIRWYRAPEYSSTLYLKQNKRKWLHTVTPRCAAIFVKSKGDFYEKQVSRAREPIKLVLHKYYSTLVNTCQQQCFLWLSIRYQQKMCRNGGFGTFIFLFDRILLECVL